ncbi:sister chromatid cohesion protein 1, partial [Ascosphaera acerosa]
PISVSTEHAVSLLRSRFAAAPTTSSPAAADGSSAPSPLSFQELFPEQTTTRSDATKMFFEVLVLATKDAISVQQDAETLGARLEVTAKKGLWNPWADDAEDGAVEQPSQPQQQQQQQPLGQTAHMQSASAAATMAASIAV